MLYVALNPENLRLSVCIECAAGESLSAEFYGTECGADS